MRDKTRSALKLPKEVRDFLKGLAKAKELKEIADEVVRGGAPDINKEVDHRYRKWTIFKLIILLLYTPLYTSIIEKRFAEFYYADLFSGSGLGYISEEDIEDVRRDTTGSMRIAGSPLIALSIAKKPFSMLYLNDLDGRRVSLLNKRIEVVAQISGSKKTQLFPHPIDLSRIKRSMLDANIVVNNVIKEIEERHKQLFKEKKQGCHALFFIDPEGLEFKRKSLEKILGSKVRNDILILFNSYGAALQTYNHIHLNYSDTALRECLGGDYEDYLKSYAKVLGKELHKLEIRELSDGLLKYYQNIFTKYDYEVVSIRLSLIEPTIAKSEKQEREFDLIYATKRTSTGNPYVKGFIYIKELVENIANKYGYGTVINAFIEYIVTGQLPGLLKYIIPDLDKILTEYSTYRRYGLQH